MGNAKIWWYPDPGQISTVEEIDLGESLSDMQIRPHVTYDATEGLAGGLASTTWGYTSRVRIVLERFTGYAVRRDLDALANHLRRGGTCSIAEDADKAVAGYLQFHPVRAVGGLTLAGRPWPYNGSAALVSGDEIVLQTPSPEYKREILTVSSVSSDVYTLSDTTRYNYQGSRWVLARHLGFWPALRLPADQRNQEIYTHDHRISFTLDCMFEEAIDILENLAEGGESLGVNGEDGYITLDEYQDGGGIDRNPGHFEAGDPVRTNRFP